MSTPDDDPVLEPILRACPFCGAAGETLAYCCGGRNGAGCYIACDCGAEGPTAEEVRESAILWNLRSAPVQPVTNT